MDTYEVMYKIVKNKISEGAAWQTSGPSHYVTQVQAWGQSYAEQMVKNMNGGSDHCHIISARKIS